MKKKLLAVMTVGILVLTMISAFVGCQAEGEDYADLVAVRINNRMAEWENIDYNFTNEGSSKLSVQVPYTNYLQFSDLIVSPNAHATVYEDEEQTKIVEDVNNIYVDGDKTLYVKVENKDKVNNYVLDINVRQDNLPPEKDIATKQYDNREGHIYIAQDAETVTIDGEVYYVIRRIEQLINRQIIGNHILAKSITLADVSNQRPLGVLNIRQMGVFDANCYHLYFNATYPFFETIQQTGVLKNAIFEFYIEDTVLEYSSVATLSVVAKNNYGTIENVKTDLDLVDKAEHKFGHQWSFFASVNKGEIKNCINTGDMTTINSNAKIGNKMSVFATENYGTIYNCVNTGTVENNLHDTMKEGNGASTVAYMSMTGASYRGVYNLGECTTIKKYSDSIDKKLNKIFMKTQDGQYPDMSTMRNYIR